MNFYDAVLRDLPVATYKLNAGNNGYTNIAGGTETWTSTTPVLTASILSGSPRAMIMNNANATGFTARRVWKTSTEQNAFSLECVVLPLTTVATPIALFSHTNSGTPDGIYMTNEVIGFAVKFNAGTVSCEWSYPDFFETYHIVATYTPSRLQLWVNGEMVASADVPSGFAESKFSHTLNDFYLGSGGAASFAADGYSAYTYVLNENQIKTHFQEARDVVKMDDNVGFYGGTYRDGTERRIFQKYTFTTAEDWLGGELSNVSVADDSIRPTESQESATLGISMAGTWLGKYLLDTTELATVAGIKAEWNGDGNFTVQSSLDGGSTYQAVTNGELIPTSQGINPSGKNLLVRVSFTGGTLNDVSAVRDLTLTAYRDNYIYGNDTSRSLAIGGYVSTASERNEPLENNSMPGIHVYAGFLTMFADTNEVPQNVQTLEFWIKPKGVTSGVGGYVFDTRGYGGTAYMWLSEGSGNWGWAGATAVYINGVAASSGVAAKKNEWSHIVFVFPAGFNTNIAIAGGQQIADYNLIATYPAALTATQVLALYNAYQTQPVGSMTETAVPSIFEPANPFVMTSLDWATLPQQ
jgi:hypothetical protein